MSFRGRGRGRGGGRFGGGFGGGYCKPVPFVLFPDVELPDVKAVSEEKSLVIWESKLQNYWKASPYYLQDTASKSKNDSIDIERYSDWGKANNASKRISLNQILQLQSQNFPKELIGGPMRQSAKKMRWNLDGGLAKLDMFEKMEKEFEEKEGKEKKGDGEEEEEDREEGEGAQSDDYSDDGDYNENEYFDDDEDDYNMEDGGGGGDDDNFY